MTRPNDQDEEDEIPLIELNWRLERIAHKVEEELSMKSVTSQEEGVGCTKKSSREMVI